MWFNSEQRARNSVAEQAIRQFQDSLTSPDLCRELGGELARFTAIANRLYVPNVKNGIVSPPKRYKNTDHIAVVALHASDKISVTEHFTEQTARQREAMSEQLIAAANYSPSEARADIRNIEYLVNQDRGMGPERVSSGIQYPDRSVQAETWTSEFSLPLERSVFTHALPGALKWARLGRPALFVRYSGPDTQVSPSSMLHESVHIEQVEEAPLQPTFHPRDYKNREAYSLATELPAYIAGAISVRSRLQEGLPPNELQDIDRRQLAYLAF